MAITKGKKQEISSKISQSIKNAQSVVFVNFHGLSVSQATELRSELRQNNVGYTVAKKTLIRRALTEKNFEGEIPELNGEIAIAYGDDLIAPAKEVYEFAKKAGEKLEIVGGVFEGRYMDKSEMTAIAQIPPREVLYGQFVNMINWPIQGLVVALDQIRETKGETASSGQ